MDDRQLTPQFLDRYSGATSRIPTLETKTPITTSAVPGRDATTTLHRYDPRGWSLRNKLLAGGAAIVLLLIVIVVPVEVVKNRYPKYTPLDYTLTDTYEGTAFFDHFTYFTEQDPTSGFVIYVNQEAATDLNLTHATETSAILRVDASTPNAIPGRNSVRIESINKYDNGLFIFDILHTPFGCATWPALWLTDGYNWPSNGEIDVLETTNEGAHGNEVTLHTTKGCTMKDVKRKQTGQASFENCDGSVGGNTGCGVIGAEDTYGDAMNKAGGGVYALELREAGIRAWFFRRDSIPADITASKPDPSTWGTALADFPGTECDVASHFRNQSIIANIDLCGELAGQPQFYDNMYHCPATCTEFVKSSPESFVDAFWEFKSFNVYHAV